MEQTASLPCSVIIVTHESSRYLPSCLEALKKQSRPPMQIIIVDSGSSDTSYLDLYENDWLIIHRSKENVGFCKGNNIGFSYVQPDSRYVLFLNPDAFLTPSFLEEALSYLEKPQARQTGALSGLLLGYDIHKQEPTGKIDSSGIFRTWYGRWYDRSQGKMSCSASFTAEEVPALCGALMLCRKEALESVLLAPYQIMDSSFYMYKEDIDLSLRLRRQEWRLLLLPSLIAYHCRGWQVDRSKVPKKMRLLSARNEVVLHFRMRSPCIFYSLCKYIAVRLFNL